MGYICVSSLNKRDRDSEAFKSPDVQRDAMVRWAKARYGNDHKWVGWFQDLDRSGASVDRPKLNEAVAAAKKHKADIVVFDFSRYSRNERNLDFRYHISEVWAESGVLVCNSR